MSKQTVVWRVAVRALAAIASLAPALGLVVVSTTGAAIAKAPGKTYCFVGKCHRVKTLGETISLVGKSVPLVASHYNDCRKDRYNPCGLTSSGEPFHPNRPDNAASPIYPDGTVLLVRNPATNASAVLRINNAGPYWGNRKLDVSYAAAEKLGFRKRGVAKLETRILAAPNKTESKYRKRRAYRPLPGYIGKFDSLKDAERTALAMMVLDATAASVLAPSNSAALLIAARRYDEENQKAQEKKRRQLAPILKTMRMIADMKPASARSIDVASVLPSKRDRMAPHSTIGKKPSAVATLNPRRRLANAIIAESEEPVGRFEERAPPARLIQTAEVGARADASWRDLLRNRLGEDTITRISGRWNAPLPYAPVPGRSPRDMVPPGPYGGRYGLAG